MGLMLLTFCLAWYFVIFAVVRFYDKRFFTIPVAWTALEFIRGNFLGGMPWLLLGSSQYSFLSIIQISSITSVYGVSFVVALANAGVVSVLKKKYKEVSIVVFVLIAVFVYGQYCLSRKVSGCNVKVGIVQPNISQEVKWDPQYTEWMFEKLSDLTGEIDSADVIVWPETVLPTIMEEPFIFGRIKNIAKEKNSNFIIGSQGVKNINKETLYYNSAFFISNTGGFVGEYSKMHLVPFGEYVPFVKTLPFLKWFTPIEEGFTPGTEFSVIKLSNIDCEFSAIICFEDIFPNLARHFVKRGADVLVNLTNDAWYDKTCAVYQHAYLSIFRAVENGVPLIRATNTGSSCLIDHTGKINAIKPFVPISESMEIIVPKSKTFYTKYGDVFGWVCVILFLIGGNHVRRIAKRIKSA
jgi:apolipoprotein N-acyltransferase